MDNLILNLNRDEFDNYLHYIEKYNSEDWKKFISINEKSYDRIMVYKNENIEIYIITWNSNQNARIHDHSEKGCYLKILQGCLEEKIYDNELNLLSTNIIKEGDISFMHNKIGFHSIHNNTNKISVSLHIYSPPNHKTKFI
jgi:predicted metal-dependent enzyme (double-stranded beta helix superfamily)